MVSDNLTQELLDRGLTLVNKTKRTYDANMAVGGPILQGQAVVLHVAPRVRLPELSCRQLLQFDAEHSVLHADLSRPAIHQQDNYSDGVRFTYQASAKDKIASAWDFQHSDICLGCSPLVAPEATYLTKYARSELPAPGQVDAPRQQQAVLRSRRLDADLQLAEHRQARSAGDLDSESEHRLPVQRAAGLESGPARRQPVEPARLAQLRHRFTRVQSRLHDAGSLAPRVVRPRRSSGRASATASSRTPSSTTCRRRSRSTRSRSPSTSG